MSDTTTISWTDATFNPWWGCTKVSPACDNCYAERDAKRYFSGHVLWGVGSERRVFGEKHWSEPLRWARTLPAKLGRRPRVFCASMADVFDKDAPAAERSRLFALIDQTPQLDWLLLTKRVGNVARMLDEAGRPGLPANVWLGATVINQEEADRDIPKLLVVRATKRFLSIDLHDYLIRAVNGFASRIDWVIAGGESGPKARPTHPDWLRSLRDQCASAGVAFHFKQWGEWTSVSEVEGPVDKPNVHHQFADGATVRRVRKKAAGRLLDGVEHNGFPA